MAATKRSAQMKEENTKYPVFWVCPICGTKSTLELTRKEYFLRFPKHLKPEQHTNVECGLCGHPSMTQKNYPDFPTDGSG